MVEIFTVMENGVDFIIDRLYRGSVINFRSYLLRDKIAVFARCMTPVSMYFLTLDKFYEIRARYPDFHYEIKDLEDCMVDKENPIALDYILSRKKVKSASDEFGNLSKQEEQREKRMNWRTNLTVALKNSVMTHI